MRREQWPGRAQCRWQPWREASVLANLPGPQLGTGGTGDSEARSLTPGVGPTAKPLQTPPTPMRRFNPSWSGRPPVAWNRNCPVRNQNWNGVRNRDPRGVRGTAESRTQQHIAGHPRAPSPGYLGAVTRETAACWTRPLLTLPATPRTRPRG